MGKVSPIPPGNHTITVGLVVRDGKKAIEFYKHVFGAKELDIMLGPDGGVMHAEVQIGDTKIYLGEEARDRGAVSPQTLGGSPVTFNVYTEDCDAMFKRAVSAGARATMPLEDMFWGDRYGKITDPFGHQWGIATHKEDVSRPEMERRARDAMAAMTSKQ